MIACPVPGPGVAQMRALLTTVDCNSRLFAESGYRALTEAGGVFPAALTALMTIYVALLGYRLLFGLGGARVSDAPLVAVKIGAILALTLNWTTFQTLVFDLAYKAPIELAQSIGGPMAARIGDPVQGAQDAYDELIKSGQALGRQDADRSDARIGNGSEGDASRRLFGAAETLFMATVGVLAVALIAVGVLSAIGPIFIALFLFAATRGLFVGWLRALVTAALAPLVGWSITVLMLVALRPGLRTLAAERAAGSIGHDTVSAVVAIVTVFAIAQLVLVGLGALIGAGMRLRRAAPAIAGGQRERSTPVAAATAAAPALAISRSQALAEALRRPGGGPGAAGLDALRGGAGAPGRSAPGGAATNPRTQRLGELYRRPSFRARQGGRR